MKYLLVIFSFFMLISCGKETEIVRLEGTPGVAGRDGRDGKDSESSLKLKDGLICRVYDSLVVDRSNGLIRILNNATPKFTKVIQLFDVGDSQAVNGFPKFTASEQALIGTEDYALDCFGYLDVPVSGNYTFKVLSDDNSRLAINDVIIINMDQLQSPSTSTSSARLLYSGLNRINVLYFQGPHTQIALRIDWSTPNSANMSTMQLIPSTSLQHMVME